MMKRRTRSSLPILITAAVLVISTGCRRQSLSSGVEAAQAPEENVGMVSVAQQIEAQQAEAAALEAELESRSEDLDERARRLAAEQESLAERERALRRRETQVDRRLQELEGRLRDLEETPVPPATGKVTPPEAPTDLPAAVSYRPVEAVAFRLSLPEGTVLSVELLDALSSRQNRVGDTFRAAVSEDVSIDGEVAVPAGSMVLGRVVDAVAAKRIGGQSKLALSFTDLEPRGGRSTAIEAEFALAGRKTTKKDAATIGGAAAGGAILGRVIEGDDEGGIVGAIIGAAAGAAIAAGDRDDVELPPGTAFELRLARTVHIVRGES